MDTTQVEQKPENVISLKAVSNVTGEKTRTLDGVTFKLAVMMHKADKNQLLLLYEEKIDEKPKFDNPMEMMKFQMRIQLEGPITLARQKVKLTRWDRLLGRTLIEKSQLELKRLDARLDKHEADLKKARSIALALSQT